MPRIRRNPGAPETPTLHGPRAGSSFRGDTPQVRWPRGSVLVSPGALQGLATATGKKVNLCSHFFWKSKAYPQRSFRLCEAWPTCPELGEPQTARSGEHWQCSPVPELRLRASSRPLNPFSLQGIHFPASLRLLCFRGRGVARFDPCDPKWAELGVATGEHRLPGVFPV